MEKKDFKVGQKVYLRVIPGSNAARYIKNTSSPEDWIKKKIVTAVGRKYITVADNLEDCRGEEKFDIARNFAHYYTIGCRDYELFLSKEDILNDMQCESLYKEIKKTFSDWNNNRKFTFAQLKEVHDILCA